MAFSRTASRYAALLSGIKLKPHTRNGYQQRCTKSTQAGYALRRLTLDDKEAALDFLNRYFREEPMAVASKLFESPDYRCKELEDVAAAFIDDGTSLVAVDDKNDLIGIMINTTLKRQDSIIISPSIQCPNPKFRRILEVLEHLERQARLWENVPHSCDTVLMMEMGSTRSDWRNKGLATQLIQESERLAREIGACAIRMDTTSAYTGLIGEHLKYKLLYGVKYADLPFAPKPKPPHTEARAYIKNLV